MVLFIALPAGAQFGDDSVLLDICNLAFALVSAVVLTRQPLLRSALLSALLILALAPTIDGWLPGKDQLSGLALGDVVSVTALFFNALVTSLVARHVFGPGRVTVHKVQGAVLIYLNMAAVCAILFSAMQAHWPGAIAPSGGGLIAGSKSVRSATISYFSLTTLTTTGYGDLVPVHPFARSLANFEALFGQLFPATLLARVVALNINESLGRLE